MPHFVKPQIDGDWTGLKFECTEPEGATCRLRCPKETSCEEFTVEWIDGEPWHVGCDPDNDYEEGPLHKMSDMGYCGVTEWDALDEGYAGGMTTLREGEIRFTWNGDFYEWVYATDQSERDSARNVAVTLEQENAHLVNLIRALADDLIRMDSDEAIDLTLWPAAGALVAWKAQP